MQDTEWVVRHEDPPEEGWNLRGLLDRARVLLAERERPVVIAIDVVLGLPTGYLRSTGNTGFLDALEWLDRSGGLVEESGSADTWSVSRPFFRVHPRGLSAFQAAAGGRSSLLREIEILTGGNSVFILSGIPGTVGSGSRALWIELAREVRDSSRDFEIWPFEGDLLSLTSRPRIILAELYPRAAYALALSEDLPARPLSIGKTKRANRSITLEQLSQSSWVQEMRVQLRDMDLALDSEDCFDALVSAAALVRLMSLGAPLSSDLIDRRVEGGILPTGMLDFAGSGLARRTVRRADAPVEHGTRCPIPGCSKIFRNGRLGWDAHVASFRKHPQWHPEIASAVERKSVFRREFASWFPGAS